MAERVQQVKGPGARPPRGVKVQVENPMKILARIMKYILKDYTVHCIAVVIAIFVNVLANVQGTMFMKTLIDGYITPMLTQSNPDFTPLLHAILRVAGFSFRIAIISAHSPFRQYIAAGCTVPFLTFANRNLLRGADMRDNMQDTPCSFRSMRGGCF